MKSVKSVEGRRAFALNRTALERLVLALGGEEELSQIVVEFSDGSTTCCDDLGEVLELGNGEGKRIEAVGVECARRASAWQSSESPFRYVWVRLRAGRGSTIRYHISGEERDVLSTAERLDEWTAAVGPWYGRIAALDGPTFAFLSLVSVGALAATSLALREAVPAVPHLARGLEGAARADVVRLLALLSVALPPPLAAAVALLRGRLFPVAAFAVGQGERRERRAERLRRSLGWAAAGCGALAVAAGAASGLLG